MSTLVMDEKIPSDETRGARTLEGSPMPETVAGIRVRAGAAGHSQLSQEDGHKGEKDVCATEADVDQGVHPGFPRQADALHSHWAAHHSDDGFWLRGKL